MTPVTILDEAEAELAAAVQYYDSRQPGLGLDFAAAVASSVESIRHCPARWPVRRDGTRRYLVHRFPYVVVYLFLNDHLWVIAIAHCKRRPDYWSERRAPTESDQA